MRGGSLADKRHEYLQQEPFGIIPDEHLLDVFLKSLSKLNLSLHRV